MSGLEAFYAQLPALQIVVPMLTAPLCVLARKSQTAWALALVVTWGALGTSILLLRQVLAEGVVTYAMGGWPPPLGIELRLELANAFVLVIVTGISAVVLSASPTCLGAEVPEEQHYLVYAAFLLCMTGLLGMTSAGDAFNIFVFLEISSLSSYTLIALGPTRRALIASFRYLILGTVGGTFILFGIGLLYGVTGTLNIAELGALMAERGADRTALLALTCVVLGASIKLALFPLGSGYPTPTPLPPPWLPPCSPLPPPRWPTTCWPASSSTSSVWSSPSAPCPWTKS